MAKTKNILDRKFVHHAWFLKSNITRKQAIEYFAAHYFDFQLKQKVKGNSLDNLLDDAEYSTVLYGDEDGRTWTMTDEEVQYFKQRVQFYKEFWKEHCSDDLNSVPEYQEFTKAFIGNVYT